MDALNKIMDFYYCSILVISLIAIPSNTLRIPKPIAQKHPEIWLSRYTEIDSYRQKIPDKRFRSQNLFKNDFISKNGSDYVIYDGTSAVVFTCEATYPISWKFPFPEQLAYTTDYDLVFKETRISDFSAETPEPLNIRFQIRISIQCNLLQFLSVNLTCSSVENTVSLLESSVYIFLNSDKMGIENEGETLHVSMKSVKSSADRSAKYEPLVLPCRPASPDMKLLPEKETVTSILHLASTKPTIQKSWNPLTFPKNELSFDPKVGYTLQRDLLGDRIFGLYRCSVLLNDNDTARQVVDSNQFVLVNVTMTTKDNAEESGHHDEIFEPRSILHGKASVHVKSYPDGTPATITCCTGVQDKPPKMYQKNCDSPFKCKLMKKMILEMAEQDIDHEAKHRSVYHGVNTPNVSNHCEKRALYSVSQILVCKGVNVEFVEQYFNLFHPLAGGPVTNRSTRIKENNPSYNEPQVANTTLLISLTEFVTSATAETATAAEKMIITVGRQVRRRRNRKYPIYFFQQNDVIFHDNGYYDDDVVDDTALIDNLIERIDQNSIHIVEYNRDSYYEGESLIFMCFGVKLFYTWKPHLRLNWENGTMTMAEETPGNELVTARHSKAMHRMLYLSEKGDMYAGNGDGLISIFGKPISAKQGMLSVDCWMPLNNSSRWDKISKPIRVLPSVAPRFLEDQEESLYFYLGDVGNVVTCTLIGGLPSPWIMVTRDGKRKRMQFSAAPQNHTKQPHGAEQNATKDTESVNLNQRKVTININFPDISHEHQTVIQCIAKNVNGTAKRTVKVFVIDKPSKLLAVSVSIVGVLCVLLLGLGVKHWHDKKTVVSLRANNI